MKNLSTSLNEGLSITSMIGIAEKCSHFKIGKTGQSEDERRNAEDYRNVYPNIKTIAISNDPIEISRIEAVCIDKAKELFPKKCDNDKDGQASLNDKMGGDAPSYRVYIVWK